MKKTIGLFLLCAAGLLAQQRDDLIPFLALMQASNETPALADTSSANALIWLHVVSDGHGNALYGAVDFNITAKFSGAVTVTGLHIHSGTAGSAGPIVIPTDVNGANSVAVDASGSVTIRKQVPFPQVAPAVTLATIQDMVANPQNYYVNIHTTENPNGAMRGQLMKADATLLMALMSPKNEVPPTPVTASGVASVVLLRGRDAAGNVGAAEAIFNLQYTGFDAGTVFTGFHIHNGIAGTNGPVIINTGIASGAKSVTVDPTGAGNLNYEVPMSPLDPNYSTEVATVNGLFSNPQNYYINIHTTAYPGGVMRDQLRNTEMGSFQVNLQPGNETPPITGLPATGQSEIVLGLLRNADGSIAAGTVLFDIDYRGFPAGTIINGLHIHQAAAGVAGPVVISSGLDNLANKITSDTGNGDAFRIVTVADAAGVAALNGIVQNPAAYYVNMHTTVNPGGAMRDQLGSALAKPAVGGIAAVSSTVSAAAPGSIISIYGTNLAGFTSDLSGFNQLAALPNTMNGVTVTVGGVKAPVYFVSPGQLNVQTPFEVTAGPQPVVVTTSAGSSAPTSLTVSAGAPSIFILDSNGTGAIVKNADFSVVTPLNPVKPGDTIVIYSTGLGQTTPAGQTGTLLQPPAGGFNNTAPVVVTIGGQNAPVVYSIASPGFAGLYQTAVTVPNLQPGTVKLILSEGTAASNSVGITIGQ